MMSDFARKGMLPKWNWRKRKLLFRTTLGSEVRRRKAPVDAVGRAAEEEAEDAWGKVERARMKTPRRCTGRWKGAIGLQNFLSVYRNLIIN